MMKKLLTISLLLLCGFSAQAQYYVLDYDLVFHLQGGNYRYNLDLSYEATKMNSSKKLSKFHYYEDRRALIETKDTIKIPATVGRITKLSGWTEREVKVGLFWFNDDNGSPNRYFELIPYTPKGVTESNITSTWWGLFSTNGAYVTINHMWLYPELIMNPPSSSELFQEGNISISTTAGFPASVYKWQYNSGNGWVDVPTQLINPQTPEILTFSAESLLGMEEFLRMVSSGASLRIRIFNPVKSSEEVLVGTKLASPRMISYEVTQESCSNTGDAVLKVTLSRKLYDNERLTVFENSRLVDEERVKINDFGELFIFNLKSGTYNFRLRGSVNGIATYSDAEGHTLNNVVIQPRPAITFECIKKDVSCNLGSDGFISVRASGGTGEFTARVYDNEGNELSVKDFTQQTYFYRLKAGVYKVRVTDSNSCYPRQSNGDEVVSTIEVLQPENPVVLTKSKAKSPLAFNSSDGSITVSVSGGSPDANGYTVKAVKAEDNSEYSATLTGGDSGTFEYTFSGLAKGRYLISAYDSKYPALDDETKNTLPCNCVTVEDYYLEAPLPLMVELQEYHYVTCHGNTDGQVVAHAKGGVRIEGQLLPYKYKWFKITDGQKQEMPSQLDSIARNLTAGFYAVEITDANGISLLSDTYELVEPDELLIRFETVSPNCSGTKGKIKVIAEGGTPPYRYSWNKEGETSDELTTSAAGYYFVKVTDSRGCFTAGEVELVSPKSLQISATVEDPKCYGSSTGKISATITGGTEPYNIQWTDNLEISSLQRENLAAGKYELVVTDASGCMTKREFTLTEPEKIAVSLSEGFTLGNGQSRKIRATANRTGLKFTWYLNDSMLDADGEEITVSEAGIYTVVVTDEKGCSATASVEIKMSSISLPFDITVPSIVAAGDEIHAVNISRVDVDRVEWLVPKEAVLLVESNERLVFKLLTPGKYEISAIAYKGDASSQVSHNIEVVQSSEIVLPKPEDNIIKQFLLSEDEKNENFSVYIELSQESDYSLSLYSPTKVLMDRKEIKQSKVATYEYELIGSVEGIYTLELNLGVEKAILNLVKKTD